MKKYRKETQQMRKCLQELGAILEVVNSQLAQAAAIEDKIVALDRSLPDDTAVSIMPDGPVKEEILDLFDMINLSYDVLDEIFGDDSNVSDDLPGSPAPTPRPKKVIVS